MKCEIILGAVSPIWHDFAIQELADRFKKWAYENHPELFNEKRCSDETTNQHTASCKPKKYKRINLHK